MIKKRAPRLAAVILIAAFIASTGWIGSLEASPATQAETSIRLLELVEGTLSAANPTVSYVFRLTEGFPASLTAQDYAGTLALSMSVTGPTGDVLARSQPMPGNTTFHVIEAMLALATATYTVTLTRGGTGSGEYSLLLLPGYASLETYDNFEMTGDSLSLEWTPSSSDSNKWDIVDGAAQLTVLVPNMLNYFQPEDDLSYGDLYIESDVRVDGFPSYCEYGFLVHLENDPEEFYAITFSSDSDWSVYYFDGEWIAVQPWTATPVVDGADKNPHIGVLIRGSTFRLYFNDQFVGEVTDTVQRRASGTIALVAATGVDQADVLTVYHDNVVITTPLLDGSSPASGVLSGLSGILSAATQQAGTPVSGLPFGQTDQATPKPTSPPAPTPVPASPTPSGTLFSWASSRPSDILAELQQQGVVPAGGSVSLTVPSSFGDTSSSGFNYYPLGQGRRFRNFVLAFDASLEITGLESGCGMHFRNNGSSSVTIAMVTEDGAAFLGQLNAGELDDNSIFEFSPAILAGQGAVNRVTVAALEQDVRMYVNGELVAHTALDAYNGTVALEVYVAEDDLGRTQRTYCQLDNIWLWEF